MPELPEVQTFCRFLQKHVLQQKILDVKVYFEKIIRSPSVDQFVKQIKNQTILKISRRGKYLIFHLDRNVLIVHLRMEGRFLVKNKTEAKNKNSHLLIRFVLDSDLFLDYEDSRRFGTFNLESHTSYQEYPGLKKLGLEPFDNQLTPDYLREKWKNRRVNAKTALLEQTVIAGIGNIYACEILYLCQISPFKTINQLSLSKLKELITHLRIIMQKAIELNGTTVHTFSVNDQQGEYWKMLKVYRRKGENCQICQTKITFQKINQRGTFFCSFCQKK